MDHLIFSIFFLIFWFWAVPPAAARIAENIANEEIFSWFTAWVDRKFHGTKIAYLVRCPLCLSHWVIFFFAILAFPCWLKIPGGAATEAFFVVISCFAAIHITALFWLTK